MSDIEIESDTIIGKQASHKSDSTDSTSNMVANNKTKEINTN